MKKLTYISKNIDGGDFRGIIPEFGFGVNETGILRKSINWVEINMELFRR